MHPALFATLGPLHSSRAWASVIALTTTLACSSSSSSPDTTSAGAGGGAGAGGAAAGGAAGMGGGAVEPGDYDPTPVGGTRPTKVYVPGSYVAGTPMPLVVLLHGYGASGALQEALFLLKPLAESRGFLYVHPDGLPDAKGSRAWNGAGCCDAGTDDVAYLTGLVTEISSRWSVDPKRIHFTGHSNGAFMSHRMACEKADMIASIAPLAGDNWADPTKCQPSSPVAVVQIHGDADMTIPYGGGTIMGAPFPSATDSVLSWVSLDGCGAAIDTSLPPLDLDSGLAGSETTRQRWTGCNGGSEVQLWTIAGGAHIPNLTPVFGSSVIDFLFAHPKK